MATHRGNGMKQPPKQPNASETKRRRRGKIEREEALGEPDLTDRRRTAAEKRRETNPRAKPTSKNSRDANQAQAGRQLLHTKRRRNTSPCKMPPATVPPSLSLSSSPTTEQDEE
ncbi:hypothetical protein E2562_017115 [Oryza meyeriana var. granulata]|uniref:Uncharacterized protein n=1 Tax=Oryza meyeriana var. granulata TaxID=110450 RepID=A0A6G1DYB7_9ORYZ|nr:hypothetical protein E2562_017115 [Oryza meyeriana var. granulata]